MLNGVGLGPALELCIAINPSILCTAFMGTAMIFTCFTLSALLLKLQSKRFIHQVYGQEKPFQDIHEINQTSPHLEKYYQILITGYSDPQNGGLPTGPPFYICQAAFIGSACQRSRTSTT
ncbi:hypothetical protein GH733_006602 [Mirounga leonina]|nr:hypothetical protein GH733_006602 [Mirounga leonina]